MTYFIMSLDGGGIRGIMTAKLLERLEREKPFINKVDLIAGTSTGGILALGLANDLKPGQLVDLYLNNGEEIFSYRDIADFLAGPADELLRANYDNETGNEKDRKGLKPVLEKYLKNKKLDELKKKVLITTFDLDNQAKPPEIRKWKPKFLHNYGENSDGEVLAVDAAVRTSAAPTFFPSYQGYIDGGVVANNPATCALSKAVKEGEALKDIWLLSVGTGINPKLIRGDRLDWGITKWATKIIDLLMDGMPSVADYQCRQLLGPRYHRLDVVLEQAFDMDDVARIDALLAKAESQNLEKTLEWLGTAIAG
jgi:patatin-like phospholipase/acyl hydrolase